MTSQEYYNLLGINSSASQAEIKKAYRRKAKVLHPDRNKAANAQEQFLALSEAYEFLSNPWKVKTHRSTTNYTQQQKNARESAERNAQERARRSARMKYKEFINSDAYKLDHAGLVIWNHVRFVFSIVYLLALSAAAIWTLVNLEWGWFIGVLLVTGISFELWIHLFTEKQELDFSKLKSSLKILFSAWQFWLFTLLIFNTYVLFNITLHTVVGTNTILFGIFLTYVFIVAGMMLYLRGRKIKLVWYLMIPISIFNFFFFINFEFSDSRVEERYHYHNDIQHVSSRFRGSHTQESTYLFLSDNQYEGDHWIRVFPDINSIHGNWVVYYFEEGLFGMKVMKDYRFE